MNPDQTAPIEGAVWSGFILFAIMATKLYKQILFVLFLFDLILYVPYQQSFSYTGMGLPGLNQY